MATNEEMLVSAFQEKVSIRPFFNLANMISYIRLTFDSKQFQNGCLAAILNLSNFMIFTKLKKMKNGGTMNIKQNVSSHTSITHDNPFLIIS